MTKDRKDRDEGGVGQIIYEKKNHIGYFTIKGDKWVNPLGPHMCEEFYERLLEFRDDIDAYVGIVTGAGDKAFSVGGDMKNNAKIWETFTEQDHLEHYWYPHKKDPKLTPSVAWQDGINVIELYKPMIAAIRGYCLGAGFMFVLMQTDIRIAAEDAKFGLPEATLGIGGSAATILHAELPKVLAMELALTGEEISAQEAHRIGLINRVVPGHKVMSTAEEFAKKLCEIPWAALRAEKEGLIKGMDMPYRMAVDFARNLGHINWNNKDMKEKVADFRQSLGGKKG